ncbi:MAG: chorismate synthase [Fibrobacter sp.]|jgi:chorismate synthase|nr:chorismate synthase [Fibrobacter sp.]
MSSIYGKIFKVSTWGESHGKAIGAVIDGCPSGIPLTEEMIQKSLDRRRPGQNLMVTPRKEADKVSILSGVFEGKTTGTPISLMIPNEDQRSHDYSDMIKWYRPGHADLTYDGKYGFRDYHGGGRSSARETAARVAAGAIARQILEHLFQTEILAWVTSVGGEPSDIDPETVTYESIEASPVRCPDPKASLRFEEKIKEAKADSDSVGALVTLLVRRPPKFVGEPVFEKVDALLAQAMLSLPACKGFEIGLGFEAAKMRGSKHNDEIYFENGVYRTRTNNAGGTLGGITNGEDILCRMPFKPTSTIGQEQKTAGRGGVNGILKAKGRHDPCVGVRAPVIVESMAALVLIDLVLRQRRFL